MSSSVSVLSRFVVDFEICWVLIFSSSVAMSTFCRPRFDGRIFIHQDRVLAAQIAEDACAEEQTAQTKYFNLFCDGLKDLGSSVPGGIAVTYQPWGSHHGDEGAVVREAWPVYPIYDHRLGELLALSECLVTATFDIARYDSRMWSLGVRPTIVVRIFNDNMFNLMYLDGKRRLDEDLMELAEPVLKLIATQSWALRNMRPGIQLELHWIPGHQHDVWPHVLADQLSRDARSKRRSYSSVTGDDWLWEVEPCVVRWLKQDLVESAARAATIRSKLRGEF